MNNSSKNPFLPEYFADFFTGLKITDLVSFYTLPSTVMNHPTHNNLKAAYSFYNVATSASWVDLIGDALVLAKKVNDIL